MCPKIVGLLLLSRQDYCMQNFSKLLNYMPNTLCILKLNQCHLSYEVLLEIGRALPHLQVLLQSTTLHHVQCDIASSQLDEEGE